MSIILVWVTLLGCEQNELVGCFPADQLSDHITPLTSFGQRSEWSLDGQTVYFVDSAGGDAWMVNIHDKTPIKITKPEFRPEGHGYYRIVCLSNGDFLLTCGPGRRETYIQIWDKSMKKAPVTLSERINEGPAITRNSMTIAWTPEQKDIWLGRIVYEDGIPKIIDKKLIIENSNVVVDGIKYEDMLEPQSFRPPNNNELIWSQYGHDDRGVFTSETMGYDIRTGALVNYSKAPGQYDEPEGIFPDGEYTLIECDHHNPNGTAYIDIYKLRLDTAEKVMERLTFFNEVKGFRSSNPVVRDDGKMIAFQASISGTDAGVGCGIYLFDLEKYYSKD
jgi:hypothetical protein